MFPNLFRHKPDALPSKHVLAAGSFLLLFLALGALQLAAPIHLDPFFLRAVKAASRFPYAYYVVPGAAAVAAFLFLAIGPVFSARFGKRTWRILFLISIFLAITALRWPFLGLGECNLDESQNLAIANTLLKDPAYWRSVDPGSHGPLTELPLLLGRLAGFALDYSMAKSVNLLLVICSTWLCYAAFARIFSERCARIACIPMVLFHALTHYWDFLGFSAETPLIFLLAAALFQLGRLHTANNASSPLQWYFLGLLLGSAPYSKLQGVPMAMAITLWGLALVWKSKTEWKSRLRLSGWYALGGVTSSLVVTGYLLAFGLFNDFIFRYVLQNFLYTQRVGRSFASKCVAFVHEFTRSSPTHVFFTQQLAIICLFAVVCSLGALWNLRPSRKSHASAERRPAGLATLFAFVFALACVYSICVPGHIFPHYLLLLVPAVSMVLCAFIFCFERNRRNSVLILAIPCVLYASLSFTLTGKHFHTKMTIFRPPFKAFAANRTLPVSKNIRQLAAPGQTMTIWGWFYRLHVETGLPMATRTTPMHIFGQPQLKETYLNAFVEEFTRAKPDFFVEAVGPGMELFNNKKIYGVGAYPQVKRILEENYELLGNNDALRLFRRVH